MLAWLHKRIAPPWTRRTRWTPLLETQREFQRTLAKERARVDRNGGYFGFVILRMIDLKEVKGQCKCLARMLHRRLRDTDAKGHLGFGRIGIVLPMTDQAGSELVMEDVISLAQQLGITIEGETFVYPEPPSGDRAGKDGSQHVELPVTSSLAESKTLEQYTTKLLSVMLPRYPLWKRSLDVMGAGTGLQLRELVQPGGPQHTTDKRDSWIAAHLECRSVSLVPFHQSGLQIVCIDHHAPQFVDAERTSQVTGSHLAIDHGTTTGSFDGQSCPRQHGR